MLLEIGLSESLAGRFEELRMSRWSYQEMKECFGFSLDNTYLTEAIQDAGNTVTLTGYINLLDESRLLCGLLKFSVDMRKLF